MVKCSTCKKEKDSLEYLNDRSKLKKPFSNCLDCREKRRLKSRESREYEKDDKARLKRNDEIRKSWDSSGIYVADEEQETDDESEEEKYKNELPTNKIFNSTKDIKNRINESGYMCKREISTLMTFEIVQSIELFKIWNLMDKNEIKEVCSRVGRSDELEHDDELLSIAMFFEEFYIFNRKAKDAAELFGTFWGSCRVPSTRRYKYSKGGLTPNEIAREKKIREELAECASSTRQLEERAAEIRNEQRPKKEVARNEQRPKKEVARNEQRPKKEVANTAAVINSKAMDEMNERINALHTEEKNEVKNASRARNVAAADNFIKNESGIKNYTREETPDGVNYTFKRF